MAFPTLNTADTTTGNITVNATSTTVTLPGNRSVGDLLVIFFSKDGTGSVTFPAGWTPLTESGVASPKVRAAWRVVDGTEAATISVTHASEMTAWAAYRISGQFSGGTAIEQGTWTTASTGTTSSDPPSLSPSWGADDTLWFAVTAWDPGSSNPATNPAPTNFTHRDTSRSNNTGGVGIIVSSRAVNSASQDPASYTYHTITTPTHTENTFAIRPAAAGTNHTTNPTDTVSLSDNISLEIGRSITIPDTLSLSDSQALMRELSRAVADSVTPSDTLALMQEKLIADTVGLADSATPQSGKEAVVDDSVSVNDSVSTESGKQLLLEDTLSLTDALAFAREMTLADTLAMADALAFALEMLIADTLSLSDNAVAGLGRSQAIDDTLSLSDSQAFESGKGVNVDDSVSLADALRFDREMLLEESVSLADLLAFERQILFADAISLADAFNFQVSLVIDDSVVLSDNVTTEKATSQTNWEQNIDDSVSVSDSIAMMREILLSDSVVILDAQQKFVNGELVGVVLRTNRGAIVFGRF